MNELKKKLEIKKIEREKIKKISDELEKELSKIKKKIEEIKIIYYKIDDEYYELMTQLEIEKQMDK